MEAKQLVVFLCKCEEWDKYKRSNPGFPQKDLDFTPKESWLFHEDIGKKRAFLVTSWSEEERKNASAQLDSEEGPDATQLSWREGLYSQKILETLKIGTESEVIVFIHWGDTSTREAMTTPSIKLQEHLNKDPEYSTWKIYSLSSKNMGIVIGPHRVIFDVEDPVIPVSNFDAWYEMYKLWWQGGHEAVETSANYGSETTFPNHKDGRVCLSKDVSTDSSGSQEEKTDSKSDSRKSPSAVSKQSTSWRASGEIMIAVLAFVRTAIVGSMMAILSLVPLWLTFRCLQVMSFQAKTTRGTVFMLLVALLATIFAEIVWGWLFLAMRSQRRGQAND